jgi:hypothetical protein
MRHKLRYSLTRSSLAAILILASAPSSMAEPDWTVTVLAGAAKEQRRGRGWKDASLGMGLSGGWALTRSRTIEADLTYVPDLFPDNPIISAKQSVVTLTGTLVHDLSTGNWQPYVAVGGGLGVTRFAQPQFGDRFHSSHWGPAVNAGGGIKRRLSARMEVRADVRYIWIRDASDDVTDLWRIAGGFTVLM